MLRKLLAALLAVLLGTVVTGPMPSADAAPTYKTISGAGSTWAATAIDAWRANVAQYGLTVDYGQNGSSAGRAQFKDGTIDYAGSDIPYGITDGTVPDPPPSRAYAYVMDVAGGTSFMYNLKIGPRKVTNLRLSGENLAKIFTGVITHWNDPAIAADNPGLTLPAIKVIPVVRADGSGATAHFTEWMIAQEKQYWTAYCAKTHRTACTETSTYPVLPGGMVAQSGDQNVAGYVAQSQSVGAIGYVQYSYAISAGFPVAKMLNPGGYYTEPTPGHVAVALLKAKINLDKNSPTYLSQDLSQVYTNSDPRSYPLSNYSYMILPTDPQYDTNKGYTLGSFVRYALCQGQNQVDALGYSALPINLAQAGLGQLGKIHGAGNVSVDIKGCQNPTFSSDGTNTLAKTDPFPPACDKKGPTQCVAGTGGSKNQSTPVKPSAQGGGSNGNGSNGGSSGGGSGNGGSGGGGSSGGNGSGAGGSVPSTRSGAGTARTRSSRSSSAAAAAACDPDSGNCDSSNGDQGTGDDVNAAPTSVSASLGDGLRVTLMVLAVALLLGLALGPPLIAQASARRRARRGAGT